MATKQPKVAQKVFNYEDYKKKFFPNDLDFELEQNEDEQEFAVYLAKKSLSDLKQRLSR